MSKRDGHLGASLAVASLIGLLAASTSASAFADGPSASAGESTGGVTPNSAAKTTLVQDSSRLALKLSGRVSIDASGSAVVLPSAPLFPSSALLATQVTGRVVEPQGNLYDDLHHSVSDSNYWNFCSAGAASATLYYWVPTNVTNWSAGNFTEPYGPHQSTTYWASSDTGTSSDTSNGYSTKGRAYLMYIAEQVQPPTFSSKGLDNFNSYPTAGASLPDTRDVLNWEASGHSANWQNYFYFTQNPSSPAALLAAVEPDITGGKALIADVDTGYLSNWSRSLGHAITIIGYNNTAGTYTYLDTCGHACNGSSQSTNGGIWSISQAALYNAIHAFGVGITW